MAACSKKLLKAVEADLLREVELQKARRILQCFSRNGGRGVPTVLVKAAVKTLYNLTRKQSIKKEQKVSERISKYAGVIEENVAALSGLVNDVMFDTESLLDVMALDDPEEAKEEGGGDDEDEDDFTFLSALLQPQPPQKTKPIKQKRAAKTITLPEVPTSEVASDNEDEARPGGGGVRELA